MERLQAPQVFSPAPSAPGNAAVPSTPGAATQGLPGTGVPGTGVPGGTSPGGTGTGTGRGIVPAPAAPAPPPAARAPAPVVIPPYPPLNGPYRLPQRRSLADMANEQLRRDRKPSLEQNMEAAEIGDCMRASEKQQMLNGLLALPGLAAKALSDRCAK